MWKKNGEVSPFAQILARSRWVGEKNPPKFLLDKSVPKKEELSGRKKKDRFLLEAKRGGKGPLPSRLPLAPPKENPAPTKDKDEPTGGRKGETSTPQTVRGEAAHPPKRERQVIPLHRKKRKAHDP